MVSKLINTVCGYRGCAKSDLAQKLNISRTNFSNQMGRDNFTEKGMLRMAAALGCHLKISLIDKSTGKEFSISSQEEAVDGVNE